MFEATTVPRDDRKWWQRPANIVPVVAAVGVLLWISGLGEKMVHAIFG